MVRVLRAAPVAAVALCFTTALSAQTSPAPAPAPAAQQAALRLAWLNSQTILANTPGRAAAESLFAREMATARTEVTRMQSDLDSAVAVYQRTQVTMTPAAKTAREEQLRQQEARTRQRAQDLDQQMQQREAELTAPIMTRVNAIIEGLRAELNLAFVFDVAAQGNPIVTADRALDITNLVIQRLQAAGDVPAPAPAGPVQPGNQPPMASPQAAPADTTRAPARPPAQPTGPRVRPTRP